MPSRRSPRQWRNLELQHLLFAYRKAKADCYYERVVLAAEAFAQYEQNLLSNLSSLLTRLRDGQIDQVLAESVGQAVVAAKKLTLTRKDDDGEPHDFFSAPDKYFRRLKLKYTFSPEFRLIGKFPVQMHVMSALWINLVGHKFDATLDSHAHGSSRLYAPLARLRLRPGEIFRFELDYERAFSFAALREALSGRGFVG